MGGAEQKERRTTQGLSPRGRQKELTAANSIGGMGMTGFGSRQGHEYKERLSLMEGQRE